MKGVAIEGRVEFLGRPIISVARGSKLVIRGENHIFSGPRCNLLGIFQPCVLRTLNPDASLLLGRGVGLSGVAVCAGRSVTIGEGTIVGSGAMIFDNDFHASDPELGWIDDTLNSARPVEIGNRCFIGARAIILKGTRLGDGCVVGAGAVVSGEVPAGAVVGGNPARPLRSAQKVRQ